MGRRRRDGAPSTVTEPDERAARAVTNRDVVPASRASRWPSLDVSTPPLPSTVTTAPSTASRTPSASRHSIIATVSSPGGTFATSLGPSASAAHTSARLAMLFEPGTVTTASSGRQAVRSAVTAASDRLSVGVAFRSSG